ncbi:MAG: bifunctional ornithine acetyltransferase/N-acetylglutamate synthase, partial [Deltaproteobacteria bacterium]|nr:bifunctional ornithine acetyltransferase/N-acetylglutamate synthase [Deltaproteobacteria bacterium]
SVDSDTSTSDTVVLMASGEAGPVPPADFERALEEAAVYLAREIARDGEGATRLVELAVEQAPSREAALKIAKSVINSPLVKTAIHGADPNWGRFIMAVGKVFEHPVPLERLSIRFGGPDSRLVISAGNQDGEILRHVSAYIKDNSELRITISLGAGEASELVWGCDMSAEYVRINADYTT